MHSHGLKMQTKKLKCEQVHILPPNPLSIHPVSPPLQSDTYYVLFAYVIFVCSLIVS